MNTSAVKINIIYPVMVCLSLLFGSVSHADKGSVAEISVELPAQALEQSLITVGKKAKITILFQPKAIKGLRAPELRGTFDVYQLIALLLADTAFEKKKVGRKAIAIIPKSQNRDNVSAHELEEMLVYGRGTTGTHISSSDIDGLSPVDVVTRYELQVSNKPGLGEFLKFIPAVSGNSTSTAVSNGGNGTATVTLRGLPANNTLVLLNGQRIAFNADTGASTDLNSINMEAVDRVEIFKDGASAVYGADAIAGVINIITRDRFDGVQVNLYQGISSREDIPTSSADIIMGRDEQDQGVMLSLRYFEQEGLFSRQRALSQDADGTAQGGKDFRSKWGPVTVLKVPGLDGYLSPIDGLETPTADQFEASESERSYNYREATSSISPSERTSIYLAGYKNLDSDTHLNLKASLNSTEATITLAPLPFVNEYDGGVVVVSASNRYNPFNQNISSLKRRIIELGPRVIRNNSDSYRVNLGIDKDFVNWHFRGAGFWSKTKAHESKQNNIALNETIRGLGPQDECRGPPIDNCVAINLFGAPGSIDEAQLNYIRRSQDSIGVSKLFGMQLNMDGTVATTRHGDVSAAFGMEARRETYFSSGNVAERTLGGNNLQGSYVIRSVREAYAELELPLVSNTTDGYSLILNTAARYSNYSDFGESFTPKIGLKVSPSEIFALRFSYSSGFRAPTLGELGQGAAEAYPVVTDPCTIAEDIENKIGCTGGLLEEDDRQKLVIFEGSPDLEPERSYNTTIGIVWTPDFLYDAFLSIDHFYIQQKDIVSTDENFFAEQNAYGRKFGELVIRDENGQISQINAEYINIGRRKIAGIDFSGQLQWQHLNAGDFRLSLNASRLIKFKDQVDIGEELINRVGTFQDAANDGNGALPKWKINTGLYWRKNKINAHYSLNFIGHLHERVRPTDSKVPSFRRKIEPWYSHNINILYMFGAKEQHGLSFGIDNLLDEAPPFIGEAFNDNYDPRSYDIKGRYFHTRLQLRW